MAKIDPILRAQGQRLRKFREAAGYKSARAAALGNGWPESSYRAHEAGTRTIGQDDAERYAALFRYRSNFKDISAQAILFGAKAIPDLSADLTQVPLLSWVAAGRLTEPNSQILIEDAPRLTFAGLGRGKFFALKVDGDSMDRISPDGSIIVVDRAEREPIPGKPYVFHSRNEGTSYKIWRPDPPRLAPLSTNPTHEPIFLKNKREIEIIGRVRRTMLDL